MQMRGRVINKLALVLLSIVVLELVLIGDQVQPVKAIKKKIIVKKLKKLLPLLALIKPKKKIILLPIPIPMFNKNQGKHYAMSSGYGPYQQPGVGRPTTMGTMHDTGPMSFMMVGEPSLAVGSPAPMEGSMMHLSPMVGPGTDLDPIVAHAMMALINGRLPPANGSAATQPPAMAMPSVTMTIQSEPGGGSNIELSTNMMSSMGSNSSQLSGALMQRPHSGIPPPAKVQQQQQQQQYHFDNFDEPAGEQVGGGGGGEHYYSSPWTDQKSPLSSPAKIVRNERFRQQPPPSPMYFGPQRQQQMSHQTVSVIAPPPTLPPQADRTQQHQQQPSARLMPVLVIRNQWRPTPSNDAYVTREPARRYQQQPQQLQAQASEHHELVGPMGPQPQSMPFDKMANGRLQLAAPPSGPPALAPPAPPHTIAMPAVTSGPRAQPQPQPPNANYEPQDESSGRASGGEGDRFNAEVDTIGGGGSNRGPAEAQHELPAQVRQPQPQPQSKQQAVSQPSSGRLESPVAKGKQQQYLKQQQQQQQQQQRPSY